jgi:exopolysaccharide biosynthesis polyprenyl glycosylphosphotransferase
MVQTGPAVPGRPIGASGDEPRPEPVTGLAEGSNSVGVEPPIPPEHAVPSQRQSDVEPPTERIMLDDGTRRSTVVLPYIGSSTAERTRSLRAWMLALPIDFVALAAPVLWNHQYWKASLAAALVSVGAFATGGLYRARRHLSVLDELPSLYFRFLAATAAVAIVVAVRHGSLNYVDGYLQLAAASGGLLLPARALSRMVVLMARRRRWVEHSAVIVGGGPIAIELARLLRRYPQYGLRFAGFVDVPTAAHDRRESMPLIGYLDDLSNLVRYTECDVVIIADIDSPESAVLAAVRSPGLEKCDLWMVPRLREFQSATSGPPDHIGAIPVVPVRRALLEGPKWALKRTSDIVLAGAALLLLSPVLALCALASFADGGRGIIFRQQRIGQFGKPFDLLKFRSMRPANEHESQTNWNIGSDPRVGPIGRFLRRTSLDELPQLWNIVRGDMTIVGPRPERPYFVDQFSVDYPEYAMRHRVPVGLTGLAQVSGLRGDTPISDRARFDNYYIENWSLWLDVKVLLRTVGEVFRGGGR